MLLNRIPGRFTIRIVVSKEQARAGMVTFEYIAEPKGGAAAANSTKSSPSFLHGPLKWVAIAVLAGGAVAAGAVLAGKSGGASSTPATTTSTSTITIGTPSITVGKP
jgi:hypothetical protein